MSGYRKIHIDSCIWEYRIGDQYLTVKSPRGQRKNYHLSCVTGVVDIERERYKSSGPQVTPSQVAIWITNNKRDFK